MPLLPLARALRRQGHKVAFATAAEALPWLRPEGFEVLACGPDTDQLTAEAARRAGLDILFTSDRDLTAELFAGVRVDLMADAALEAAQSWAPSLIVCEHYDLVGPLVAGAVDVPCAVAVTTPAPEEDQLAALAATVRSRYTDRGLRPPSRVPSGRWLLDLCPPSMQRQGWRPAADRIELRAGAAPRRDEGSRTRRPAGTGRPRVLVDLGTEAETSVELGPVLRSLTALDVDLVVAAGDRQVEHLEWAQDRVRVHVGPPAADDWEAVRAVLHHGAPEITLAAVVRGLPAVVVAQSPAHREQAECIAAAGAGIALPASAGDPALISESVGRLLSEPGFTAAAAQIRDDIVVMPTAPDVAGRLVAWVSAESGTDNASDGEIAPEERAREHRGRVGGHAGSRRRIG